jgi:hypothetical protein
MISVFTTAGKGYASYPKFDLTSGQNNSPPEYFQYLRFIDPGVLAYVVQPDDALEFGIHCIGPIGGGQAVPGIEPPGTSAPNETRDNPFQVLPVYLRYGVDLVFTNRIRTSQFGLVDQNGIDVASGNKYPNALDRWYTVTADLSFFAGFEIDFPLLVNENDFGGDTTPSPDIIWTRYIVEYKNILIRNQTTGAVQKYLYQSGSLTGVLNSEFQFPGTGYIIWTLEAGVPFPTNFLEGISADYITTGGYAGNVITVTTNTTVNYLNQFILSNGAVTITLPTAIGHAGHVFHTTNIHGSADMTVAADGSELIDNTYASITGGPGTRWSLVSDGIGWYIFNVS